MTEMLLELSEAPSVVGNAINACTAVSSDIAKIMTDRALGRILVAARGSSLNAGIAFKFFVETTTPYVVAFEYPSIVTAYHADRNLSDTLYVIISQSGAGPDTLEMALNAKAQGAVTVACCNFVNSALSRECDFLLNISAGEEKAVAATKTLTGEIVALQCLAAALCGKTLPMDFASSELEQVLDAPLPDFTAEMRDFTKIICLSRGYTEAVARECGLKLTETCYMFAYSASVNEFQHGPKALIEKGQPVILFAPGGRFASDYIDFAHELKSQGAFLISFTDLKEVASLADYNVQMPALCEDLQTTVYLVAMQRFAERLCAFMGKNPDAPRNLHKITITN